MSWRFYLLSGTHWPITNLKPSQHFLLHTQSTHNPPINRKMIEWMNVVKFLHHSPSKYASNEGSESVSDCVYFLIQQSDSLHHSIHHALFLLSSLLFFPLFICPFAGLFLQLMLFTFSLRTSSSGPDQHMTSSDWQICSCDPWPPDLCRCFRNLTSLNTS